jgi:hypothetical protein
MATWSSLHYPWLCCGTSFAKLVLEINEHTNSQTSPLYDHRLPKMADLVVA